jgi:hypothetical protein
MTAQVTTVLLWHMAGSPEGPLLAVIVNPAIRYPPQGTRR